MATQRALGLFIHTMEQYRSGMDIVETGQEKHLVDEFITANRGLSDNEFLSAAVKEFGFILDAQHRTNVENRLATIRTVMVIFLLITGLPVLFWFIRALL